MATNNHFIFASSINMLLNRCCFLYLENDFNTNLPYTYGRKTQRVENEKKNETSNILQYSIDLSKKCFYL